MSTTEKQDDSIDGVGILSTSVQIVLESKLLMTVAFGVLLALIGALFLDGTIAGMFGIWGATAVLIGLIGLVIDYAIYKP